MARATIAVAMPAGDARSPSAAASAVVAAAASMPRIGTSLRTMPNQKLRVASGRGRRGASTAKKVHQVRIAVDAT